MLRYLFGTKIDRYFYKELIVSIILVYIGVLSIFIMLDFASNSDFLNAVLRSRLKEYEANLAQIDENTKSETVLEINNTPIEKPTFLDIVLKHYLSQLPFLIYLLTPIVTTLAISFTVIRMSGTNEFLIMKTSGIPIRRVLRPALMSVLIISTLLLAYNAWGLPAFVKVMHENRVSVERKRGFRNLMMTDPNGIILYAGYYENKPMKGTDIFAIESKNDLLRVTEAETLEYKYGKGWMLGKGLVRQVKKVNVDGIEYQQMTTIEEFDAGVKKLNFKVKPGNMGKEALMLLEEKSISELFDLVKKKPQWTAPKVQLHRNFAFPLAPLLLYLITISLILNNQNRNMLIGVGLSILFSFGYYGAVIVASGAAIQGDIESDYAIASATVPFALFGFILYLRIKS
ncbi:MAG: LptF/LptG family permease [Planctomycetes bacterium]|nr:LptF/LptG family permease [Planctomycetota bacterium]